MVVVCVLFVYYFKKLPAFFFLSPELLCHCIFPPHSFSTFYHAHFCATTLVLPLILEQISKQGKLQGQKMGYIIIKGPKRT